MAKPYTGVSIETRDFRKARIIKELGSGGQGTVYLVDYDGQKMALKWYHESTFKSIEQRRQFYDNLCKNIDNGSPSDDFLWPKDITHITHGSFGYIMDLRPDRFKELSVLLVGRKARFKSFRVTVDAMLNLVNAFRILHNSGYSYQDLNDGNFFFDPDTGECLICDNDNAAYEGNVTGILGKQRYMAPEVVLGQKMPDKYTDRFSMSVILFMMLMYLHPLEGEYSTPACMTAENEREFYGRVPVFVFDPEDGSNPPVKGVGDHAVAIWNELPEYLRKAYIRSFTKGSMTFENGGYKGARLVEREWLDVLLRFRNTICRCPSCGNEEFVSSTDAVCAACGDELPLFREIKLKKYSMPVYPGMLVRKAQLYECPEREALDPVFEVVGTEGFPGRDYIVNMSGETWRCITSSGAERLLAPGERMPAKAGIKASVFGAEFEII